VQRIPVEQLTTEMRATIARLEQASLAEPLRACLPLLRAGFGQNIKRQQDSMGGAWPDRNDDKPHPLLRETGALWAAVAGNGPGSSDEVAPRELTIIVDKSIDLGGLPGAAVHNFGYPAGNVPQREYLYASEETLDRCGEALAEGVLAMVFA